MQITELEYDRLAMGEGVQWDQSHPWRLLLERSLSYEDVSYLLQYAHRYQEQTLVAIDLLLVRLYAESRTVAEQNRVARLTDDFARRVTAG